MSRLFSDVTCPNCDGEPVNVDEARREADLVQLGYMHTDVTLHCENKHEWTHGVPHGEPEIKDVWNCDVCGSWYIPRDLSHGVDDTIQIVVKCMGCLHKPDRPIRFDIPDEETGNNKWRVLLGHPLVCGNTEDATEHNAKLLQ